MGAQSQRLIRQEPGRGRRVDASSVSILNNRRLPRLDSSASSSSGVSKRSTQVQKFQNGLRSDRVLLTAYSWSFAEESDDVLGSIIGDGVEVSHEVKVAKDTIEVGVMAGGWTDCGRHLAFKRKILADQRVMMRSKPDHRTCKDNCGDGRPIVELCLGEQPMMRKSTCTFLIESFIYCGFHGGLPSPFIRMSTSFAFYLFSDFRIDDGASAAGSGRWTD